VTAGIQSCLSWQLSLPPRAIGQALIPPKADIRATWFEVRFVPCVDGSELARTFFTLQAWSVQPCVRPIDAVHMTAGHNALRGSGPGQKPAFDNALAQVGCPDRRIDRLCITCCSSSPTFTSRRVSGAISFTPRVRRAPCSVRPWPSWPRPSLRSCWQARWRQPSPAAALAMR
jgi:hypothetical protein